MMRDAYELMHQAIVKTGRPMVYSLCQYGWDSVWDWGPSVGANLWRTTGDINATFDRMASSASQAGLSKFAGPGHWNDPDMLEVGNGKLNATTRTVTHMTLWAMLAAPLLAGNNLTAMTPDVTAILTNREVIAIDQDPLGKQGDRIYAEGPIEIWSNLFSRRLPPSPSSTSASPPPTSAVSPSTSKKPASKAPPKPATYGPPKTSAPSPTTTNSPSPATE